MTLVASPRLPLRLPFAKHSGKVPFPNPLSKGVWSFPSPRALIDADFLNWRVWDGTNGDPDALLDFTYTENSNRTIRNGSVFLASVSDGKIRRDFRPGKSSALVERAATNAIRNNVAVGLAAGSPGTLPTNWQIANGNGLTRTISTETVNGEVFTIFRFAGTTTDNLGLQIAFESSTGISASTGQTWTEAVTLALDAGSLSAVTSMSLNLAERGTSGSYLTEQSGGELKATIAVDPARFAYTATMGNASTLYVQPRVKFSIANATAVDFTFRIGTPQLAIGNAATSEILTSGTAATRNAETVTKAVSGTTKGYLTLAAWKNMTPSGVYACIYSASGKIIVRNTADGTGIETIGWDSSVKNTNSTWGTGQKFSLVIRWDATEMTILYTGSDIMSATLASSFTPTLVTFGSDWNGSVASSHANANIERLAVGNG
jgi:hypothetical protein